MDTEKYIRKLILVLMGSSNKWVKACGYRLSLMKLVVTPEHETMAVDGRSLFVSPTWPHTRHDNANLFTLIHEALHVWFRHPERLRKWQGPREVIHMAADYAINLLAVQQGCEYPMPDDGLFDKKYVDQNGKALSAELIAHMLMQELQQEQEQEQEQEPGGQPGKPGETDGNSESVSETETDADSDGAGAGDSEQESDSNGADSESGNAGSGSSSGSDGVQDTGLVPESCGELLPAPADYEAAEAAEAAIAAATLTKSSGDGSLPEFLQQAVHDAAQDSETHWLQQLHDRFATIYAARDFSYEAFHQGYALYGMIEPTLYSEGIGKVAIVGDESGSMSDDELNMVNSQTAALLQEWEPSEVLIIRHDSEIVYTESLQAGEQPTPRTKRSYGGTDFQPVLDMCADEMVDVIVWVTDCMPNDRPRDNGIPAIFLGTSYGSERWHNRHLWGDYIHIEK